MSEQSDATTYRVVVKRELDAPRELVWKAWTEPEQIQQWLKMSDDMTTESVRGDLRAGGKFRIQLRMAGGEYYTAAGTYVEVSAPERLVYTWDWEKDGGGEEFGELEGNETKITVELHAMGDRTELVLTHEKLPTIEKRDNHEKGWTTWIGCLAKFVEN